MKVMYRYKKIIFYVFMIILGIVSIITIVSNSKAGAQKEGIENFPESYRGYLEELKKKHPDWTFTALYTGFDWKYVIDNENVFGKNLVPKSYSDYWKNTNPGEYNVEVDSGWVDASRKAVEYAMDPRNFLNEVRIFQFEALSYDEKTNNKDGIEKILYGTEFYKTIVKYYDSSGNNITTNSQYSDLILKAGITSRVSSYHLASRIKQEVGPFLTHGSISGTVKGYEGYYNFYNIGATSSSEPMGAIKNGLQYAKDGKGASQETKDKYLIPWNTKEKAISGGGIFIGSSYINKGQDTIYLQKFHVSTTESGGSLFWHQYMTNVLAPYSESKSIYTGYVNSGLIDGKMSFIIPVYDNMPSIPVSSPSILDSDYTTDNTKVYADVSTTLNIRSGPGSSYEIITSVDRNAVMTRIAKGKQSGELWDKVVLSNGIVGYAFQSYLKEVPQVQISQINLSIDNNVITKGETKKLQVEILPEEAKNHTVLFSSSDTNIARVDSQGNILGVHSGKATITVKAKENDVSSSIEIEVYSPVTDMMLNVEDLMLQIGDTFTLEPIIYPDDASNKNVSYSSQNEDIAKVDVSGKITAMKEGETLIIVSTEDGNIQKQVKVTVIKQLGEDEIKFDDSLKIYGNEIIGFDEKKMTVGEIKGLISSIYEIQICNSKGEILDDTSLAGTGSKIKVIEDGKIIMEYQIVLYGDVNGDGKINSVDLLVLQRHILEIEKLKGVFLKAGNIRKNGANPSSLDSLLIQRHILELELIEQ